MRLIEEKLANNNDVITVWFNAWRYEKEEHPIMPLVGTIVRELEQHKSFMENMKDKRRSLIRSLRAIAYGFSAKSKVKLPGFAEIEASFVAKDMIERDEGLTPDPLLDRSLYYQSFEALSSVNLGSEKRIVVLIDDLDRCFPDLAIRLLESIKLVLSQPGFIFILGVARRVIEGYLQHRYNKEYGIADFQGQLYLDKIVQLPFHIPPHTGRINEFCEAISTNLTSELQNKLKDILPIVGKSLGGNPRAIIRFVNNILIDIAISNDLTETSNLEEIPIEYFAISRCLQHRWPDVFSSLISSDKLSEEVAKWDPKKIRDNASSEDRDRALVAAALITDHDLEALLLESHGNSWLTDHPLRSATINFLRTQRSENKDDYLNRFDILLSYDDLGRGMAFQLAEILADNEIRVLMDDDLPPNDDWKRTLQGYINNFNAVGICISSDGVQSKWKQNYVRAMLSFASTNKGFIVVPILLPGAEVSMVPDTLKKYQWLDFRKSINYITLNKLLVDALKRMR